MNTKLDVYSQVTNKIIADLERGNLTWLQPWQGTTNISRPLRAEGKPYRGINVLMLWAAAMERGFNSQLWMTYKQAAELGGQVKKGEKGSLVVYADKFKKSGLNEKGEDVETTIPFMKGYSVFNADQVDGLPQHFYATSPKIDNGNEKFHEVERFFAATQATIKQGGNSAFYRPSKDLIQMPDFQSFRDSESYYATLAHEMTHWTRHESRLNREFGRKRFGDSGYAMEELVAEIGSAFLCSDLNITPETREDHAAYVASWLKVLKDDKRAVFTAASHAQKAVDLLHSYQEVK